MFSLLFGFYFFVQKFKCSQFCLQTKAKAYFLLFISLEQQINAENTDWMWKTKIQPKGHGEKKEKSGKTEFNRKPV